MLIKIFGNFLLVLIIKLSYLGCIQIVDANENQDIDVDKIGAR